MTKIQTKTTGLFISIAVIAAVLVASLALWKSSHILKDNAVEKMLYQAQYQASTFEHDLSQLRSITQSIEASLLTIYPKEGLNENNINKVKDDLTKHMMMIGKKMNALSLWVVFNPELVPQNQNIDLYDKNRDGNFVKADPYNINNFDMGSQTMKWWTDAITNGEVWTEPYYWEDWDMELISYSKAIYIDSIFIGCIGSDIDFTKKRAEWSNMSLYQSGYLVLINQNFHFILHPQYNDNDAIETIPSDVYNYINDNVFKNKSGHINYDLFGIKKVMTFQNLTNGWALLAVVPIKEIYEPIYKTGNTLLIILGLVILISVGIAMFFSKTITSPIERLGVLFNEAKHGNLEVRCNINSNDELQKLGNQFNYFLQQMQTMIDQLKEKEINLTEAKEKAIESDKLKTAFLENLSHEIRTPLTGIVGYAELLNTDGFSKDEKDDFLSTIQQNNDNLLQFIEDVITFSKLERGILHPKNDEYNLDQLFIKIHQNVTPPFDTINEHITFKTILPTNQTSICIHTDSDLVIKSLKILLDNAYKFTIKGEIIMECFIKNNKWGIEIKDTGIGIPKEFQKLIFKKFYKYTSDKTKIYRGVGMGLAIVSEIVKILHGNITVHSVKGKGSSFIIEFNIPSITTY